MRGDVVDQVRNNPHFRELEARRTALSRTLAIAMLVIYFGFIILVAFAPGLMAQNIGGVFTLAFPLGIAVILSAVVITGIYVVKANGEFDRLTRIVVEDLR